MVEVPAPVDMSKIPFVVATGEGSAAGISNGDQRTAVAAWPRITVRLNGVLIHDDLELNKDFTPAAPVNTPLVRAEGPVFLQNHNDPVVFRNIWVVPKDS